MVECQSTLPGPSIGEQEAADTLPWDRGWVQSASTIVLTCRCYVEVQLRTSTVRGSSVFLEPQLNFTTPKASR